MRIAFVTNDCTPGMGLPCSAQGLRAYGLMRGVAAAGADARIVMRRSALEARQNRWLEFVPRLPPWLVPILDVKLDAVLAEFDAAVFHNWAAGTQLVRKMSASTRLVYDFFSATLVEHSFIRSDENYLATIRQNKLALVQQCDLFVANGDRHRDYALRYLHEADGRRPDVVDLPFCAPWYGADETADIILCGGYRQHWTAPLGVEALAGLCRRFADFEIVTVGAAEHYHGRSDGSAGSVVAPNFFPYGVLCFEDYIALNARARVFIDVSPQNDERTLSLSTRTVMSIAAGCPVIHNAETYLGQLIEAFGAGVTISKTADLADPQTLSAAVAACLSVDRRSACRSLWQRHFAPERSARALLDLLSVEAA